MSSLEPIKIWVTSAGPNPWKPVIILEELGIPYELKLLSWEEVLGSEYKKINPNGKVPGSAFSTGRSFPPSSTATTSKPFVSWVSSMPILKGRTSLLATSSTFPHPISPTSTLGTSWQDFLASSESLIPLLKEMSTTARPAGMLALISALLVIWLAYQCLYWLYALRKHRKLASESGWPSMTSLVHVNDTLYILTHKVAASVTKWAPLDLIRTWFPWSILLRVWHAGYEPFQAIQSDSFIITSSSGNMLLTCDPEVCQQIFARSHDFKAPIETLYIYNIYGPTLAASKEEHWRRIRKVTTPYFNTETNTTVWRERLEKTDELTKTWSNDGIPITDVKKKVAAKLIIGVIAKVFFGETIHLEDCRSGPRTTKNDEKSFSEALLKLGDRPYNEWKRHMLRMHDQTSLGLTKSDTQNRFKTLLGSLISAGNTEDVHSEKPLHLSQDEVLGNIFFFMLAGHNTASTVTSFAILLLTLHTDVQSKLQGELDTAIGGRSHSDWNLRQDFQPLYAGYLGAIVKETLCLYTPVEWLPKRAQSDTTIVDGSGRTCFIVEGPICMLDFAAMFRHPRY
ncbi:cytochrome P450 [Lindgomyces ingoldianus]|uniref:Cytochrome P450 n=1 Tax=Lindgomyces ingoldianus TaxID=673940 RepID=A0ACB6Q865_9PLEO|nr:cytochrome P450 [Lindgomyces ingoldianus]KAF2462567.1 cytochrome P450 [Lindgomyces ingoldianus]